MDSGLEKQLERIESTVAEIVEAVRKLHDGQTAAGGINGRLKRFVKPAVGWGGYTIGWDPPSRESEQGTHRDDFGINRWRVGRDCRICHPGGRDRVWSDRTIRQARETGSKDRGADGTGAGRAGRPGAGGAGSAAITILFRKAAHPLAERRGRSYLVSNGDVDA